MESFHSGFMLLWMVLAVTCRFADDGFPFHQCYCWRLLWFAAWRRLCLRQRIGICWPVQFSRIRVFFSTSTSVRVERSLAEIPLHRVPPSKPGSRIHASRYKISLPRTSTAEDASLCPEIYCRCSINSNCFHTVHHHVPQGVHVGR